MPSSYKAGLGISPFVRPFSSLTHLLESHLTYQRVNQKKKKKKKEAKEKDVIDLGRLDRVFMISEAQSPNSWKWKWSPED